MYNETGAFEEAKEQFEDEFNAYKKLGAIMDAARAERMIGEMLMLIGEHEKALKHEQNYLSMVIFLKRKSLSKINIQLID